MHAGQARLREVLRAGHAFREQQSAAETGELIRTVCDVPGVCSAHLCKFYVTTPPEAAPSFTYEYEYTLTTFDEFKNPRMTQVDIDRVWQKLGNIIPGNRLLRFRGRGRDGRAHYYTVVDDWHGDPAEKEEYKNRLKAVLEEGWNKLRGPTLYVRGAY